MDQLQAMRVFVSVAEIGSMAGAARALDIAPAVVTRQVAQLENHLGARLLQRNSRRLVLTEVGQEYRRRATAILAKVEAAAAEVSLSSRAVTGRLRLTANSALLSHALMPLLPAFRRRYPELQLAVEARDDADRPDASADLTLLTARMGSLDGNFIARLLARTEVVLCASPSYLRTHGTPLHPQGLADQEALLPRSIRLARESAWTLVHRVTGESSALSLRQLSSRLDTDHRESLHDAVRTGMGIGAMLSVAAMADLQSGRLVQLLPEWRVGVFGIYAVTSTRQHQPARVRAMVDYLTESFGLRTDDPWLARLEHQLASSPRDHGAFVEATRTA